MLPSLNFHTVDRLVVAVIFQMLNQYISTLTHFQAKFVCLQIVVQPESSFLVRNISMHRTRIFVQWWCHTTMPLHVGSIELAEAHRATGAVDSLEAFQRVSGGHQKRV